MPEITDSQIIKFANERARTIADEVARLHYAIEGWLADYTAQGISALITAAGATNVIADGSETDGRVRITGTQLVNLRAALLQVQTAVDTTTVSGVGVAPFGIANGIQVNGSPR
jgi:hypothetical protein